MKRDPNCDNEKVKAVWVEEEVQDCFRRFIINVKETGKSESKKQFIESAISKSNSKIKKLYHLYAENENDNLMEVIREEERKLKELKKELQVEISKESKDNSINLKEIRRVADVWDDLSNQEKNKILKLCVEKVIVDGDDISVHFKI